MNSYRPGDWLEVSDADEEDKEEYRRIVAGERDDECNDEREYSDPERDLEEGSSSGGAAGCVFAVALLAACLFLAWALTQVQGGGW